MNRNIIEIILGRKGTGKTTQALKQALRLYRSGQRVVVVDPMDCFTLPGVPVIRTDDPARYAALAGRSVIVKPESDATACMAFDWVWARQGRDKSKPIWLIIDEVDKYFGYRQPNPVIMDIIRYGRHRQISLITISQRPANIHNDLLAQADLRIFFQVTEPNDLAYIKKFAGVEPDLLQNLPLYKYMAFRV